MGHPLQRQIGRGLSWLAGSRESFGIENQ
ncbi:uncharacterized protein METZ01_LOCUS167207 [marine metagenome]|uniref:Uncharacterized protein n=1 Tax=marine metagenome TaxID=408172 RepID=A0A382BMN6_9ZZZZ